MSGVGVGGGGVSGWPRLGRTGPTGPAGASGPTGPEGSQGSQGAGILFFQRIHDGSDTVAGVIGPNYARFNNATEGTATEIYVSIYDTTGTGDESTLLDMLDDSTSAVEGIVRVEAAGTPSRYIIFQLNSVASGATYYTLGVTALATSHSGNPFGDGYTMWFTFVPKGDKGDTGAAGATGPTGPAGAGGSTIIVQEGDVDVDTAVGTLDFDASDFTITSSPAGEANIALAYGTSAGTPAEGNHTHLLAAGATDVTASSAELNILDGATLTVTELNYVDGVTSAIQTQLDGKQPLDADLTTLSTAFTTASASGAASLAFHEDTDNGTNRALLQGPASTADVTITLPASTGTVALTSDLHDAVTVSDTASINLTLTGQQISADAIFGTGAGVVAEGNHTHSYQPLDSDLTTLATAFTTASASGAASLAFHEDTDNGTNRALLQGPASTADVTITLPASTGTVALTSDLASYQPLDSDLTTIAGLTATTNNFMVANSSAWASRTPTQAIAHLGLDADIATLALPANTTISAFGATLVDDADNTAARTTLGLVIGTDVQAQNARLQEIASLADPNADRLLAWDDSADDIIYTTPTKGFCVPIGNGVDVISTGVQATEVSLPVGGVWTKWRLLKSLPAGNVSIVVDIWKAVYASFPPVVGGSITASAKPTITTATNNESSTLTGWTTTFAAGDTLRFNVDSVTSATRVWLCLEFREVF